MSNPNELTGDRIRECRKRLGISQEEFSQELGVSRVTVSKYESGIIDIPASQIRKIAKYFNISVDYLMGWDAGKKIYAGSNRHEVTDDDIKFALFGGKGDITDAMYEEVKSFAEYVRQREEKRAAAQKKTKN